MMMDHGLDGIRWLSVSAGRGRSPPRQLKDAAVLWPKSEILETKKAPKAVRR